MPIELVDERERAGVAVRDEMLARAHADPGIGERPVDDAPTLVEPQVEGLVVRAPGEVELGSGHVHDVGTRVEGPRGARRGMDSNVERPAFEHHASPVHLRDADTRTRVARRDPELRVVREPQGGLGVGRRDVPTFADRRVRDLVGERAIAKPKRERQRRGGEDGRGGDP